MRILVTGASGFVGRHLVAALNAAGSEVIAAGSCRAGAPFVPVDIVDAAAVRALVAGARPDRIVHLAGQAFVPQSVAEPLQTVAVNDLGTAYLLEAARLYVKGSGTALRTLVVSSAEVYGTAPADCMPLAESAPLRPGNPYAASKVAAESHALAWSRTFGLDVVVARPFNHIGPGQDARFVVASFARQLADVAAGGPAVMNVGNLDAQRDFLDVRDVANAYIALLDGGRSGQVYNICSGRAVPVRELLRRLIAIAGVTVEIRDDPARMRASDLPVLVGDASKLRQDTSWEPRISLEASLRSIYDAAFRSAPQAA